LGHDISFLPMPHSDAPPDVLDRITALPVKRGASDLCSAAFDRTAQAKLLVDALSGNVLRSNAAADALFDKPYGALAGRQALALYPQAAGTLHVFTEEVLARGTARTRRLSLLRPDGSTRRLEHEGVALPGTTGERPVLLTITDLDALERRSIHEEADLYHRRGLGAWHREERYFRELERENRLILAAAGDGIYGVNTDGVATFVNPAAERMLGYRADELVGQQLHDMIHHHHENGAPYANHDCPIYAAFRHGKVQTIDDEVFWCKDGGAIRVEYTSTPIIEDATVIGAVVTFRDITERHRSEQRLQAAWQENARLRERLEQENAYLQEEIRSQTRHEHIFGTSEAIVRLLRQIELVAATDTSVLIGGESGTGKELVALAIHDASVRSRRPMIRVNCAAVARELFESEFFGHVKGAFSGALRERVGRFELADGGTLFLDEVGEIPLDLQAKLLRVLQDNRFERVGDERTRHVDVRVIAATNRNLEREVAAGRFREDLYFRLNVFPIRCVPLRERRADIPILATRFLDLLAKRMSRTPPVLTRANMRRLQHHDWPGNARELQNVIERALIVCGGGKLHFDLPMAGDGTTRGAAPAGTLARPGTDAGTDVGSEPDVLDAIRFRAFERANLMRALQRCRGRVAGEHGAAVLLGMKPTTLASRLKALDIDARAARSAGA